MPPSPPTQIGQLLVQERFDAAASLIAQSLDDTADVPFSTQLRWFMALPEGLIASRPRLGPHAAVVAAHEQRFDLSQRWLGLVPPSDPHSVSALGGVTMQLVLAGDMPSLAKVSERLVGVISETSTLWSLAHGSLVGARYATGDLEGALVAIEAIFRSVIDTPRSLVDVQAASRPVAARLLLELGRPAQARHLIADQQRWLSDAPPHCANSAPVLWAQAMCALQDDDLDAAAGVWTVAPASVAALGLPFFEVWMLIDFARLRSACGDDTAAEHALFRAQSLLVQFRDPAGLEARLNEVGAPYGISALVRRTSRLGVEGSLSEREHDVMALLDSDLSLRQIAEQLFISQNTLKAHTRSIYRKLGVSSRLSAVRAASRGD